MARKPKTVADIEREIQALEAQKVQALQDRANNIGKIAAKADLVSMEISDADLLKEFKGIAQRFQRPSPAQVRSANSS